MDDRSTIPTIAINSDGQELSKADDLSIGSTSTSSSSCGYVSFPTMDKGYFCSSAPAPAAGASSREPQLIDKARDRISTWLEQINLEKQSKDDSKRDAFFLGNDLSSMLGKHETDQTNARNALRKFSSLGYTPSQDSDDDDDDKTVKTASSTDDHGEEAWESLSDDSENSLSFEALRQFRIRRRFGPFLPGANERLDKNAMDTFQGGGSSVWVIQVFPLEEKDESPFRFEIFQQGGASAMTLYGNEIIENTQSLLETKDVSEETVFRIRMSHSGDSMEVGRAEILDHLHLILGSGHQDSDAPSLETVDSKPEWKERARHLLKKSDHKTPLAQSVATGERPVASPRWTLDPQHSWRAHMKKNDRKAPPTQSVAPEERPVPFPRWTLDSQQSWRAHMMS